jgi:hypothetical protein
MTLVSLTFMPARLKAGAEAIPVSIPASNPAASAEANVILARLDEINAMDKSKLNSSEKKQLRKEVRSIKTQLRENHGGVYLSVGAIIIIVLLLILLL